MSIAPTWISLIIGKGMDPSSELLECTFLPVMGSLGGQVLAIMSSVIYLNSEIVTLLLLLGCLMVTGVFALGLYWFWPKDSSGLLFSLFCFSYAGWIISGEYWFVHAVWNDIPEVTTSRFENVSLCLSVIFYGYFIKTILKDSLKPQLFHSLSAISAVMIAITALAPPEVFGIFLSYYYLLLGLFFILVILIVSDEFRISHKLVWINLVGIVSITVVIGNKLMVSTGISEEAPLINFVGSVFFVFSQGMALIVRFGRTFRDSNMAALAASRTREEFLNAMSHELKTPMNAIIGMTSFLEKSNVDNGQRAKLKSIKKNGRALLSLIEDVLSISEASTGELKLRMQPLNLNNCIESALALSKQHLQKENVRFDLMIDSDIPQLLIGDPARIKQVLMHLLGNAFRLTEKGSVSLQVKMLHLDEDHCRLHFELKDTGKGISPRYRIFGLFREDHTETPRKSVHNAGETGVVDALVKLMGGNLDVKSRKGKGNTVRFEMELETHRVKSAGRLRSIFEQQEVDTRLKLLYAEDNPVNQNLLRLMLENMGLKLDLAANGEEALNMALKKYYNIIFMDIQMPVMDGLEATRKIIENSESRSIIIAVTANLAEVDRRKCFEIGMNDFISKPVQQEELKLAVIKWQGLKKYLDEPDDSIFRKNPGKNKGGPAISNQN